MPALQEHQKDWPVFRPLRPRGPASCLASIHSIFASPPLQSPPMACGFPWFALGMGWLRPEDPVPLKANFPSLSTLSTPLDGLSTLSTPFRLCSCAIFTRASQILASVSAAQAAGASKLRCSHSLDPRLPPHRRPWRVVFHGSRWGWGGSVPKTLSP